MIEKKSDPRPLKEQLEEYIAGGIMEFEQTSGVTVKWIDVRHNRGIGFKAKETIKIDIITE